SGRADANRRRRDERRHPVLTQKGPQPTLRALMRTSCQKRDLRIMDSTYSPSALHSAALELARRGVAVFPCQPRGKAPACQRGVHDATTDATRINAWWRPCPDLNIGIATGAASGFFVVDIDGDDGEATLRALEATHSALPPTVEVITGKGRHCYFRLGEHGVIGNTAGTIGLGIDTRGEGGYVLAPPSVHPTGRAYAWSVANAAEFAGGPEWIYQLIGTQAPAHGKPLEHWHSVLTRRIANGTRNTTLASIAGKLLFHDVNVALIYDLLLCVNEARCDTPLTAGEVENIVLSVGRTHFGRRT